MAVFRKKENAFIRKVQMWVLYLLVLSVSLTDEELKLKREYGKKEGNLDTKTTQS